MVWRPAQTRDTGGHACSSAGQGQLGLRAWRGGAALRAWAVEVFVTLHQMHFGICSSTCSSSHLALPLQPSFTFWAFKSCITLRERCKGPGSGTHAMWAVLSVGFQYEQMLLRPGCSVMLQDACSKESIWTEGAPYSAGQCEGLQCLRPPPPVQAGHLTVLGGSRGPDSLLNTGTVAHPPGTRSCAQQ